MIDEQIPSDLIHASFFFIDIVGLSNPILSTETQRTKIKILNDTIYSCDAFSSTPKDDLFVLPTGDGMLIGFKDGLEQPLKLAIELHQKLARYNQSVPNTERIATRIGCNIGHIFVVEDLFGNINLWGPGAILARRVMDLGDENHILLTASIAEDLMEISDEYKKILHPIYNYKIKHNEEILVYNAYEQNFGNKNPPKKSMVTHKGDQDVTKIEKTPKCKKIIYNLKLSDQKTNLLKHEGIYELTNDSIEPIYDISFAIISNPTKELQDLSVSVFDEHDELKISRVSSLSPFVKEITVKLRQPVFKGDSGRTIKIHYESEEPYKYLENLFLTDTEYFELNFSFPYNANVAPKLHYVDLKNDVQKLINESQRTSRGVYHNIQWQKDTMTNLKDMIRLEW